MELLNGLTDWLADVSANWWFLAVIFAIAYFDSVIPIVPSETTVIIGGIAAGRGDQWLVAVILAGAIGAFLGDNTAYGIGSRASGLTERLAARRPGWETRLDKAGRQIKERGGLLLVTARFIPGGRTALTVSSGITHQPRRWFVAWVALAVSIWATYAALLGYIGGSVFKDNHTTAFLVAFTTALSVTALIEAVRFLRKRRAVGAES